MGLGWCRLLVGKECQGLLLYSWGMSSGFRGIVREDIGWGGKFRGFRSGLL